MAYMALYRKWRPNDFDKVQGQDAIVQTLRNQIIYDRIGHAYLFCGTRGTGKTSVAKLFAKAVNCEHPINGNPCNACPSCQSINDQSSLDVLEIDAASNNSVDNIREIREQVQYSPVSGKYKVYIIDEVHMLSSGAFNALLKTLEEPPSYVIFILATTEKHKIPVTILSRCQKFDFKRISVDTIAGHLAHLMDEEGISVEDKALRYIARAADGSMRDALSLLDQCIAFYLNQALTYDDVLEILGTVDTALFSSLLQNILKQDTISVLNIIDDMITEGRELTQFLTDFLWYLRNLLILKDQNGDEDSLDLSTESILALKEEAAMVDTSTLLRFIRVLSDLSGQLRNATQKRVLLEVGFIRLCTPQMETDSGSLLERLRILENKIAEGIPVQMSSLPDNTGNANDAFSGSNGASVQTAPNGSGKAPASSDPVQTLAQRFSPAEVSDLEEIASNWKTIVAQTDMPMRKFLQPARIAVSEDSSVIKLIFAQDKESTLGKDYFEKDHQHHLQILSDIVAKQTGKQVKFECMSDTRTTQNESNYIDLSKIHQTIIFE